MWAMWTPGGLSLDPPHICIIYPWCLGFQPRIFSIQRIIKNSLECLFHRDAGELFSLGCDLIYIVFVYGTGNVNEFLTVWSFDKMIALRKGKGADAPMGIKLLGGFAPAVEGYSSLAIDAFILFPNHLFSHYYGVLMMCQVLGWHCYAGNCLTTNFLNKILLILSICQFLWYTHSHQYWFQAINIVTPNAQFSELVQAQVRQLPHRPASCRHCRSTATET